MVAADTANKRYPRRLRLPHQPPGVGDPRRLALPSYSLSHWTLISSGSCFSVATFGMWRRKLLIGGSMGTGSYILAGTSESERLAFSSACHGAGRAMSRHEASRRWRGRQVIDDLAARGILIRSPSMRGVAEEAPDAYKDVSAVVDAAEAAGLVRKVARLEPLICVKG